MAIEYDNKTEFLELPLPHPLNNMKVDCARIISAFLALDAEMKGVNEKTEGQNEVLSEMEDLIASVINRLENLESQPSYEIGEFYFFRHPTLRKGFQPCYGGLLENASELYPEAWEYFQSSEGQLLLKTEAEWQALTTAIFCTTGSGAEVGWGGVGGAPYFVQDLNAGTLRMPDLRGMFPEAAGFASLAVGDARGDAIREITGELKGMVISVNTLDYQSGALTGYDGGGKTAYTDAGDSVACLWTIGMKASSTVPVSAVNRPRSVGLLPCAWLGRPGALVDEEISGQE